MKITLVPFKLTIKDAGGGPRSTGLHLSELIRDLSLRSGVLKAKYADNDTMSAERVELGIAWEERAIKHHPEICFHPGELVVDGIAMSVDGISYDDDGVSIFATDTGGALHEFKLTWKSSRRNIDEEFMWLTQIKCYLHALSVTEKKKHRTAFLHVFWVNGNYSYDDNDPEGGPSYRIWKLEFSDLEIKEAWQMIINHKKRRENPPIRRMT